MTSLRRHRRLEFASTLVVAFLLLSLAVHGQDDVPADETALDNDIENAGDQVADATTVAAEVDSTTASIEATATAAAAQNETAADDKNVFDNVYDFVYDTFKPDPAEEERKRKLQEEQAKEGQGASWFGGGGDMRKVCQEMVRKNLEKLANSKSKSTLNHSVLSVITLTSFFGLGILIGTIIVLVKGRTFRMDNNSKNKDTHQPKGLESKKTPYTAVQQSEQIV